MITEQNKNESWLADPIQMKRGERDRIYLRVQVEGKYEWLKEKEALVIIEAEKQKSIDQGKSIAKSILFAPVRSNIKIK